MRDDNKEQKDAFFTDDSGPLYSEKLLLKVGGRVAIIHVKEIDWIEAQGNYVRLHKNRESYLVRQTMTEMESILDPRLFLRIHRSSIVNSEKIKEVVPLLHGDYEIVLATAQRLILSRNHMEKIQKVLGAVPSVSPGNFRHSPKQLSKKQH